MSFEATILPAIVFIVLGLCMEALAFMDPRDTLARVLVQWLIAAMLIALAAAWAIAFETLG